MNISTYISLFALQLLSSTKFTDNKHYCFWRFTEIIYLRLEGKHSEFMAKINLCRYVHYIFSIYIHIFTEYIYPCFGFGNKRQ